LLLVIAAAWLLDSVLIPVICEQILSSKLRAVYSEQSKIFTPAIASLGVTAEPVPYFNCGDEYLTRWQSEVQCEAYQNYRWSFSPVSDAAKTSYPDNASKFDALLKENGWVLDRPQDKVTTIAGSSPDLVGNGGVGGQVPFHKNIGRGRDFISCNLQVDVQGYQGGAAVNPAWTINVNEFSCSQHIYFFTFHLHDYQYRGV